MRSNLHATWAQKPGYFRKFHYLVKSALLLVFLLLSPFAAWAQNDLGSIRGTLTDRTGAVVPDATVIATNDATGVASTTTSTTAGAYNFPALPPGTYRVEAKQRGFKSLVRNNIQVAAARVLGLDLTLEVGEVSQSVLVTTESPILQTETPTNGMLVDQTAYVNLPISASGGRLSSGFLQLVPGYSGTPGGFNDSINGAQESTREIELDGGSLMTGEIAGDGRNVTFPPDAVDEMSVLTSSYSAEYGETGGGVEVYAIKSGTNQLHGDSYEFLRNEDFDSRGYFNTVRPVHRENEFGGTIGGPIVLPHIYHGRDKSFFFFSFNGYTFRNVSSTSIMSVATQAWRNGNFSDLLQGSSPQQLYDPATTTLTSSGTYTRQPFVGNMIPSDRIDPTFQRVIALYPLPNLPGDFNNYAATVPAQVNDRWAYVAKIDHYFNPNNHVSASLDTMRNPGTTGGGLPAPIGNNDISGFGFWGPRINYVLTIPPNKVNQVTLSFNRQTQLQDTPYREGGWPQQLGLLGFEDAAGNFPNFSLGSLTETGASLGLNRRFANTYIFSDGFSWTKSKHAMKFGVEARRTQTLKYLGSAASLTFSRDETALPGQLSTTGLEFASFLIGQVDEAAQSLYGNPPSYAPIFNSYQIGYYAQDDFSVTPRLSLNYGVRYEIFTPLTESHDWYSMIDTTLPNPYAGNLPGMYIFAGKNGNGNRIAPANKDSINNWGPRLGFAYKLTNRTAFRSGYGISYFQTGAYGSGVNTYLNDGYWITDSASSLNSGITPAFTLAQGFPSSELVIPPFTSQSYGVNSGVLTNYWGPQAARAAYSQNWNFNIQRELAPNLSIDIGYVGSKGTHLPVRFDINQLNPSYFSTISNTLLNSDINSSAVTAAGYTSPYPGFTGTLAQALRPFPQFTNMAAGGRDSLTTGNSTYHSLQVTVLKRVSNGFYATGAFTWSKELTDSSYAFTGDSQIDPDKYDPTMGKTFAAFNLPYHVAISFNYELPVGTGKMLLGNGHRVLNTIVGGWRLNGILNYQSGPPLGVTAPQTNPLYNGSIAAYANIAAAIPKYANLVPGVPTRLESGSGFNAKSEPYLNINAFAIPTTPFGDTRPYVSGLTAPPARNENLGLAKDFQLSERVKLEFRVEAYNAFNRVQFGSPASNLGTPQTFGHITTQANSARNGQMVGKITF